MGPRELAERIGSVQVVDVREPREWQAGRIEGSCHVPMGELPARLGGIARDRTVVVVCRSGNRSGVVTELLRACGIAAENLDGGLQAWAAAGLPLVAAGGAPGEVA